MDDKKLSAKAGNWTELADYARKQLSLSRHGNMQAVFDCISAQHGIHEQIVRRVVAAHRFLEKLSLQYPDIAKKMVAGSFAAVEQIDRWFTHDPIGAVAAASSYLNGDDSVRSLLEKESEARPQESILDMSHPKLKKWFEEKISIGLGAYYKIVKPPELLKTSSAKLFFESINTTLKQHPVAVIRVGPHEFTKNYNRHLTSIMLEAVGLRVLGYNIIVAVLGCAKVGLYDDFLVEMGLSTHQITVISLLDKNINITEVKFHEKQRPIQATRKSLDFSR